MRPAAALRAPVFVAIAMAVAVVWAGCQRAPPKQLPSRPRWGAATPAHPAAPTTDVVTGPLAVGGDADLARAKCVTCHSEDYLVQQRLTPEQWKKTVAKMKKFGAQVDDAEAERITAYLAGVYTVDLADRPGIIVGKAGGGRP